MDGWTVLDRLKHDPKTRHIPVHIISATEGRQRGLKQGALAFLEKPVTKQALDDAFARLHSFVERPVKKLLVVEDDQTQLDSIVALIGNHDVETTAVRTGAEALAALERRAVRLHGHRPRAARHVGVRPHRGDPQPGRPGRVADHHLYRQGADQGRGDRAEEAGRHHHRQGRQVARPPPRRDGPVPAQGRGGPPAAQAEDARTAPPDRLGPLRQEGADRRRRHPQRLRPDQRPGAPQAPGRATPRTAATG